MSDDELIADLVERQLIRQGAELARLRKVAEAARAYIEFHESTDHLDFPREDELFAALAQQVRGDTEKEAG